MDPLVKWILGSSAGIVAVIYLVDWRANRKLDDIHDEVKAVHTRHDHNDDEVKYAHSKIDRLNRGLALLFKGEKEEFIKWWNDK